MKYRKVVHAVRTVQSDRRDAAVMNATTPAVAPGDTAAAGLLVRTIVVGVDGSPGGQRALAWAAAQARFAGARLIAVHVLTHTREFLTDLPPLGMTNRRRALVQFLYGSWMEPARRIGADARAVLVEHDSACAGLLQEADHHRADLIVVGVQGRGGFGDRVLGSTSYAVAHRARQPVVVVPGGFAPTHVGAW